MKKIMNIVMNSATIVFGILMYVFMGCANLTIINVLKEESNLTLFELMKDGFVEDVVNPITDEVIQNSAGRNLAVFMGYVLAVFIGLMMVVAIINLLVNFGLIKNKTFSTICYIANIAMTVFVAVSAVLILIGLGAYAGELSDDYTTVKAGWGAIVNLVVGLVAVVAAIFAKPAKKKAGKSKKSKK